MSLVQRGSGVEYKSPHRVFIYFTCSLIRVVDDGDALCLYELSLKERAGLVDEAFSRACAAQAQSWPCCGSLFIYSDCEFLGNIEDLSLLSVRVSAGN